MSEANAITEGVLAFIGACTVAAAGSIGFYEFVLRPLAMRHDRRLGSSTSDGRGPSGREPS